MGARAKAIFPLALVIGVLSYLWTEFSLNFTFHWVTVAGTDVPGAVGVPQNFHFILPTAFISWGLFFAAGGDNAAVIAKHGKRINHFHTKDIRADVLAGIDRNAESFLDCVLKGVFTVPGDGMIDYDDIMKRLFDTGYEGWVIIEAEQDPAKANPLEYAKMGYNKLHQALHDAGYSLA